MIGCAPNWGKTLDGAYQADRANGANLMTITGGHQLDALCFCLGEFREVTAEVVSQRDRIPIEGTGEIVPKTSPDQLVVGGVVASGAVVAAQVRGGMNRGTAFLLEIHGEDGDLVVTATSRASMQRQELTVHGAQGGAAPLQPLAIPERYRWVPAGVPEGTPYNVAQLYARLARAIRDGGEAGPDFTAAVARHRMLDMITRAGEMGQRQTA
jgi:predicted dehydrogenase